MTAGWIKSLQCKSSAVNDVVHNHHHRLANPKEGHHHRLHSSSCKNSVQNLRDVVETTANLNRSKRRPSKPGEPTLFRRPAPRRPEPYPERQIRTRPISAEQSSFFPSLTELPEGHPSRNVVEIIFHTSWDEKKNFPGRIEMVFKVQNLARTLTRFEEYRESVKSRAGKNEAAAEDFEDHARCVADGNEVMRFCCLGPTAEPVDGGSYEAASGAWDLSKGAKSVCTYSGSGVAHEKAGGGKGRRAMLVCRVISGRVCLRLKLESLVEGRVGYDSIGGENGELLVFDSRALLPCFLIIYKL